MLAAGASTRYGGVKQHDLLPAVLAALRATSVDEVIVVEGAHPLSLAGVRVVACPEWDRGPGASLRCGLAALGPDVGRAVIVLADGPELDPRAVDRLAAHRRRSRRRRMTARATTRSHLRAPASATFPTKASVRSTRCSWTALTCARPGTSTCAARDGSA